MFGGVAQVMTLVVPAIGERGGQGGPVHAGDLPGRARPDAHAATAAAVFGITGVGATELFMYPYWCVEKAYARFVGPPETTPEWQRRARGWVRVMHVDILVSMVSYTIATLAFYLLSAGVLHGMGLVPAARDMIPVLSNIYTQTLGPWALWVFYVGAIATLYGTIFATTAAQSRISPPGEDGGRGRHRAGGDAAAGGGGGRVAAAPPSAAGAGALRTGHCRTVGGGHLHGGDDGVLRLADRRAGLTVCQLVPGRVERVNVSERFR